MKRFARILFGFGLLCGFLFLATAAMAASATVTWNANTEGDLAGYKCYFGTATGVYGAPIDVGNITSCQIPALAESTTYFFAVTAYDTSGNESGFSQEVSATTGDFTAPAAPTGVVVTVGP